MPPSTNVCSAPFDNICDLNNNINVNFNYKIPPPVVPLMAPQKNASKIGAKIRPTISSFCRHNSEPNLAKRTTLSEFMHCWNRREALSVRCRRAVPIFPLCHRMLFHRRINDAQRQFFQRPQQQQNAKTTRRKQQMTTTKSAPSVVLSPHLSPFSPSSSSYHCDVLSRSGWRSRAFPDGDLLPASWFMLSSEDLFRLHQKLQRRIDRRRSLTKANFPFGEVNRRRANILQKYRRFPANGLSRSLSDNDICFMDPKRDVETAITRGGPKGNSWSASSSSTAATNASKKRVSFSTTPTIFPPPPSPTVDEGGEGETVGTTMEKHKSAKKEVEMHCFRPLPPFSSAHSFVRLPSPSAIPVKPILARKSDPSASSCSSVSATADSTLVAEFRRRINTVTNIGDDEICAMDYATFRAWRRGSRLSVDVLNSANSSGRGAVMEMQNAEDAAKILGKSAGGAARIDIGGWTQFVKRILDDCFRHKKCKRRNGQRQKMGEEAGEKAEGKAEENAKGKAEENAKGKAEENAEGKAEENAKGKAGEKAEENAKGKAEENAKGKAEENAKGKAEENAKGKTEENAKGKTEGKAEENAEGKAEENAKGKAEENAEGKAEENAKEKAEKSMNRR